MLNRILPRQFDIDYRGHKLALSLQCRAQSE